MMRYVKRMVRRRVFLSDGIFGSGKDHTNHPDSCRSASEYCISEDRIIESRTQYYQGKLVDAMLKILYLERFSAELGIQKIIKV